MTHLMGTKAKYLTAFGENSDANDLDIFDWNSLNPYINAKVTQLCCRLTRLRKRGI